MINKLLVASSALLMLVILRIFIYERYRSISIPRSTAISQSAASPPFDFVPAAYKNFHKCDDLFGPDTAAAGFQMSSEFNTGILAFEAAASKSLGRVTSDGHTGQLRSLYKTIHYLASRPKVRNICETGFNLGHSSFSYLTGNRHAIIHSFDIGAYNYTFNMASFLKSRFPSRFFIHIGDSTYKVPEFARTHPNYRCDLMVVDSGRNYTAAITDLVNMAIMANVDDGNIIVLNDYPSLVPFPETGWAWENLCRWGFVREMMRCSITENKDHPNRGFVVGTVVRRPHLAL